MSRPAASEALRQLLRELPQRIPVHRVDHVWLFSPREIAGKESGLVVLSLRPAMPEEHGSQRQVVTLRYEAERIRGALRRTDTLAEQGWAPAERIPRLIAGVLARLGDDREDPVAETIEGDAARWGALLASVGATAVDPASQE